MTLYLYSPVGFANMKKVTKQANTLISAIAAGDSPSVIIAPTIATIKNTSNPTTNP